MTNPLEIYQQQLSNLKNELAILQKRKSLFGWLRFITLIADFIAVWQLWPEGVPIALFAFALLAGLFLFILSKDLNNNSAI